MSPEDKPSQEPNSTWLQSISAAPLEIQNNGRVPLIYQELLYSKIVVVTIQGGETFHLHTGALCRYSERFKKNLTGSFCEADNLRVDLVDEPSNTFSIFAIWLYSSDFTAFKPPCKDGDQLCDMAESYALGERLVAPLFQRDVLYIFRKNMDKVCLSTKQLSRLISIACQQITERQTPADDPMRCSIFQLAAFRIPDLQKLENFRDILKANDGLGDELCVRFQALAEQPASRLILRPTPFNAYAPGINLHPS